MIQQNNNRQKNKYREKQIEWSTIIELLKLIIEW